MIYDRIKELCENKGISINKLEAEIGVSRGSLCKIDKHKPSSEKIQRIAEILGTTSEYLLTGEDKKEIPDFEPEIIDMISLFSDMDEEQKNLVIEISKQFASKKKQNERLTAYFKGLKECKKED